MREYFIYKIIKEVADDYFGKESLLFQLFLEEYKSFSSRKELLQKQIHYITASVTTVDLELFILQSMNKMDGFIYEGHSFLLECEKSSARLTLADRHMILQSVGNYEAETSFFEVMRKFERCFFAMDYKFFRYGWLNPINAKTVYSL